MWSLAWWGISISEYVGSIRRVLGFGGQKWNHMTILASRPPCECNLLSCVLMYLSVNSLYLRVVDGPQTVCKLYTWLVAGDLVLLCDVGSFYHLMKRWCLPFGSGVGACLELSSLIFGRYSEMCCSSASSPTRTSQHHCRNKLYDLLPRGEEEICWGGALKGGAEHHLAGKPKVQLGGIGWIFLKVANQ